MLSLPTAFSSDVLTNQEKKCSLSPQNPMTKQKDVLLFSYPNPFQVRFSPHSVISVSIRLSTKRIIPFQENTKGFLALQQNGGPLDIKKESELFFFLFLRNFVLFSIVSRTNRLHTWLPLNSKKA